MNGRSRQRPTPQHRNTQTTQSASDQSNPKKESFYKAPLGQTAR